MELSADNVATTIFDDYGLSEGDSDDQDDDINGYLGAPVLKHSDLTADLGDTALRHDETMKDDVAVEDHGGMDYTIDDEASNRSISGASDSDSSNKYSDLNNKVSREWEIKSNEEEGTSAACFVSTCEWEIQSDEEGTSAACLVSTRSNEDVMLDMVSENDTYKSQYIYSVFSSSIQNPQKIVLKMMHLVHQYDFVVDVAEDKVNPSEGKGEFEVYYINERR